MTQYLPSEPFAVWHEPLHEGMSVGFLYVHDVRGLGNAQTVANFAAENYGHDFIVTDSVGKVVYRSRVCGCCGSLKPEGQSCGCFDNGGQ